MCYRQRYTFGMTFAMGRPVAKLSSLAVRNLAKPGAPPTAKGDGGGLWLQVRAGASRSWAFRYARGGKPAMVGLGPYPEVGLAEAREKAAALRKLLREGKDPRGTRAGNAFRDVAAMYIAAHEASWRNPVHRAQWGSTLEMYVYPIFGDRPVGAVDTGDVTRALEPIWAAKPETATRVRGRIEAILDYAAARGWRQGDNPARWRGHLQNFMPAKSKMARVEHHAALPWGEVAAFMGELRGQAGLAAQALEFTILTAARTGEAIGAVWGEVDLDAGVWTVPGDRMKAAREHRVPLSGPAVAILRQFRPAEPRSGGYVFLGGRKGEPLSNMAMATVLRRMKRGELTVHGFRSTFRDWCGEATNYPREVTEAAHTLRDKMEAAYRRGDLFEKRRELMTEWATYCG